MQSIYTKTARAVQKGFTLVELLIVVIILAILAAIVIPQFSSSTTSAKEAALKANLAALRSAIELYKVQHNGVYPAAVAATDPTCGGSFLAVTGLINSEAALAAQLGNYSNVGGGVCNGPSTVTTLGPYLRKGIPPDPISGTNSTVTVVSDGTPLAASGTAGGWKYDTKSGQIIINHTGTDSAPTPVPYANY